VVRGLEAKIEARYPSMDQLLAALDADPARTRRRLAVIAVVVVSMAAFVSGAVLWQAHGARSNDDPCAVAAPLAGTWDLTKRVRLRAAAIATGEPSAAASSTLAETALDKLANGWLEVHSQVCADTRQRHTQTEALLLLKLACLDRQKENLDALVAVLENPDRATVKHAARAVRQLPGANECTNARAASYVDPPAPAIAPKVAELRKRLSRASALTVTARESEAIAMGEPLAAEARQLGYGPLLAEVLYTLERAYSISGVYTKTDLLVEAEKAAVASRAYAIASRAAAERYSVGALLGQDPAILHELQSRAHDWVEREGDLEAEAVVAAGDAVEAFQRGAYKEGLPRETQAIELAARLYGADGITVLVQRQNLGFALAMAGRDEEAVNDLKDVIDAMRRAYGDDSDDLALALDLYGGVLAWGGRYDEAREALNRAANTPSILESTMGSVRGDLARVLVAEGQFDKALSNCQQGIAILKKEGLEATNLAINEDPCAAASLGSKRYDEALTQSRTCLADFRKNRAEDGSDMVPCLAVEGTALLELGKPGDAKPILEHALALQAPVPAAPGIVANLEYQVARVLVATKGDRARARELVDKARDELAKYPFKKPLLDELDSWRAKHAADLR
jgi:hypothetical protein